jgi:hypothetical protein
LNSNDLGRRWAWAAFAVALGGMCFAALDFSLWHPGVDAWDQVKGVAYAQEAREGWALPWRFGGSNVFFLIFEAALAWGGHHAALWRAPNLLAFALESLLLWRLASRLAGPQAAFGAILMNSVAALTWVRLRCLLGFHLLPLELLALLWLAEGKGRWRSLALGLGLGLVLFEYEAALLCLPIVVLWAASRPREERPAIGWTLLGLAAVLPFVILGTRGSASNFAMVRLAAQGSQGLGAQLWQGCSDLLRFLTGYGREDLLLEHVAALPRLSLVLLGFGVCAAWLKQRWLLLWALIGLAPLFVFAKVAEAHRAIAAWPALCLLGGLGFAFIWQRLYASRAACAALFLALSLGAAVHARAYFAMQARIEPLARSHWRLIEKVASILRDQATGEPVAVLCQIGRRNMAELRALAPSTDDARDRWAFMGEDYGTPEATQLGVWYHLEDPLSGRGAWLLHLRLGDGAKECVEANALLGRFRREAAPRFDGPGLMNAIQTHWALFEDPVAHQAAVDMYLYTAIDGDQEPMSWLPWVLEHGPLSRSQLAMSAAAAAPVQPALALQLAQALVKMDPSPRNRELLADIRVRLKAHP